MLHNTNNYPETDLLLQEYLNSFQIPYILYGENKQIKYMYLTDSLTDDFNLEDDIFKEFIDDVYNNQKTMVKELEIGINKTTILIRGTPILSRGILLGILIIFEIPDLNIFEEYRNMAMDLKVIFESSYDVIFVADKDGRALRVSAACEKFWGIKKEDFIGSNVFKLEEEGVFSPSVTRMVLEQGKKISTIQKTNTGRTLLVMGTPIRDEYGNIIRIVNASRDITEVDKLHQELSETKEILGRYQREIKELKHKNASINSNAPYQLEIFGDLDLFETLKSIEKQILEYTLNKYKTTVEVAKALNVSQSTISKKLNKLGIQLK